jgi:hypothetical protein
MRVCDDLQQSLDGLTMYNPASRTLVHVVSKEEWPTCWGCWMIPWITFLLVDLSSASEMLRYHRHEAESFNNVEQFQRYFSTTKQIIEDMDYLFSIECSPLFKSMQTKVLAMSGLMRDRADVLESINKSEDLVKTLEEIRLTGQIASTNLQLSIDNQAVTFLTWVLVTLTVVLILEGIVPFFHQEDHAPSKVQSAKAPAVSTYTLPRIPTSEKRNQH